MDDIVIKGMAKWPNVPAVYGWLALDRRGAWLLKGDKISNPAMIGFIGRNYAHDERGRWYFQNGPQRVYVDLEYTPLVYRVVDGAASSFEVEAQTGNRAGTVSGAWIDEVGRFLIATELGIGLVHDKDLHSILDALVDANGRPLDEDAIQSRISTLDGDGDVGLYLKGLGSLIAVRAIRSCDVAGRFAFDAHPCE